MIPSASLSNLENFSFTAYFTKQMANVNHSFVLGSVSSRIVGFVAIPFTSLADAFAHACLTTSKFATGIVISPYNITANLFFPDKAVSTDLELSSALIHLIRVVESFVTGILLPFVCLLNPERANQFMSQRLPKNKKSAQPFSGLSRHSSYREYWPETTTVKRDKKTLSPSLRALDSTPGFKESNIPPNLVTTEKPAANSQAQASSSGTTPFRASVKSQLTVSIPQSSTSFIPQVPVDGPPPPPPPPPSLSSFSSQISVSTLQATANNLSKSTPIDGISINRRSLNPTPSVQVSFIESLKEAMNKKRSSLPVYSTTPPSTPSRINSARPQFTKPNPANILNPHLLLLNDTNPHVQRRLTEQISKVLEIATFKLKKYDDCELVQTLKKDVMWKDYLESSDEEENKIETLQSYFQELESLNDRKREAAAKLRKSTSAIITTRSPTKTKSITPAEATKKPVTPNKNCKLEKLKTETLNQLKFKDGTYTCPVLVGRRLATLNFNIAKHNNEMSRKIIKLINYQDFTKRHEALVKKIIGANSESILESVAMKNEIGLITLVVNEVKELR
ncbi:Uncharacterized protein PRO82_000102 [Candidatus Protochlamydia amoebophila]|uniref:hypothetical protein n=1 Tax=Candidatus Protochlamydia amoebophila TaxID=362787 RepID=UPI001BC9A1E6|nr:hypothetical protein [Candidatus Protochlamydia amoebophila]MBS4162825.1 Uncharacterized protein [Candidatus Protochlamydia amoebophila]